MDSCETSQIGRQRKGGLFLTWWYSWILFPYWIIWGGILRSNGLAYGAKLGSSACLVPKGPCLTKAWTCPPLWSWLLPHPCPTPTSWWWVGMASWLELGGIIMPPLSLIVPKYGFSRCMHRRTPWFLPLGWQSWLDMTLSGIKKYLLRLCDPWNPFFWARDILMEHNNWVPGSVPW